jgi:hypothetical protein
LPWTLSDSFPSLAQVLKSRILEWVDGALQHCRDNADKTAGAGWRKSGILQALTDREMQGAAKMLFDQKIEQCVQVPTRGDYLSMTSIPALERFPLPDDAENEWEEELVEEGRLENLQQGFRELLIAHPPADPAADARLDALSVSSVVAHIEDDMMEEDQPEDAPAPALFSAPDEMEDDGDDDDELDIGS